MSTSKLVKNSPGGILLNKKQSVFGFSLVEFVLSGCREGVERVQGRLAFGRTPVGSWGSGACGQNHQLLPDVIRSLQQLCLGSRGTHKHAAGEGIRTQNMNHDQKEKATGDFLPECQVCAAETKYVGDWENINTEVLTGCVCVCCLCLCTYLLQFCIAWVIKV